MSDRDRARARERARADLRAWGGIACAALWILGVEVLPASHVARHGELGVHDHHGLAGHEHRPLARAHDDHASAVHAHAHAHPHPHAATEHPHAPDESSTRDHGDRDHGDGTLAHHGVALLTPPAAVVAFPLGPQVAEILAPGIDDAPRARLHTTPAIARGPPV